MRRRMGARQTTTTPDRKPLVWMAGAVKTPPFSREARIAAGTLLRRLQQGENIGLPTLVPCPR
jgi:hypothetical protein